MSGDTPYLLDGHYYQYDLGWMVEEIKKLINSVNSLYDYEIIHYADPINWSITSQYTKSTVVIDSKTGDAYISKQDVPAGIEISNTEYWLSIFNFQVQLEPIFNEISNIKVQAGNGTYIFIADSYGVNDTIGGATWVEACVSQLGIPSEKYVKNAKGGAAFGAPDNLRFSNMLKEVVPPNGEYNNVSKIIVCGGVNDLTYYTDTQYGIEEFLRTASEKFPNARVYIGMIGRTKNFEQNTNLIKTILPWYQHNSATYLSNVHLIAHDYSKFLDNVHPNAELSGDIGRAVATALQGGVPSADRPGADLNTFTLASNVLSSGAKFYTQISNETVTINIFPESPTYQKIRFNLNNVTITENNNMVLIGTLEEKYCINNPAVITYQSCGARFITSNTEVVREGEALVVLAGNKLYIKPLLQANNGSYGVPLNNLVFLDIDGVTFNIPMNQC